MDAISAILSIGDAAIKRIWPDPAQQAEEQRKLAELAQKGSLAELQAHVQLMLAQVEVNKAEAQHKSLFVAGWRPMVGWVAAISLAMAYMPKALLLTAMWAWNCYIVLGAGMPAEGDLMLPEFPDLGLTDLIGLLGAMLGIGAMRSIDKRAGVSTEVLKPR
jgi:hypothetical protein